MRKSLELQLQVSEKRQELAGVTEKLNGHSREGTTPEESLLTGCDSLAKEVRNLETQYRAAVVEEDEKEKETSIKNDDELSSEDREIRTLEGKAKFSDYVSAALEMRSVRDGASLELNDALGLGANQFPMQKLAPSVAELERRATTDSDTVMVPRSWVDRLFYGSAALSANVRETRSTQRIRVGRRQRKRTCWDCEREWKRMVVPLEPGRPSEARQLLRTRRS